jgi:indolepyruvate decarboxylase
VFGPDAHSYNCQVMQSVTTYLLSRLAELGVEHVFGVPGDYNIRMLDFVDEHPGLQWIGTANELNAAYAANGYARIKGIGALITTYGVGELSALNGIAGAYAETVPVVHIVGAPVTSLQQERALVHHALADGDFDHFARIAGQVTAAQAYLTPENAADEIDRVLRVAMRTRKPVYIVVPRDVAAADIPIRVRSLNVAAGQPVDAHELTAFRHELRELLTSARTISLLAGHLVDRFGARKQLRWVMEPGVVRAAVLSMAKGVVDETDPNFVGLYAGAISNRFTRAAVEEADVIITAGVLLSDGPTGGFSHRIDPGRRIDLAAEAASIAGIVYERIPLTESLTAIAQVLAAHPAEHTILSPRGSKGKPHSVARTEPAAPVTPDVFWQRLSRHLRPKDMIFADQGTAFYGAANIALPSGADLIGQATWASIGYTLPATLGAMLANPSRRPVLVLGDGAAQMTIQELGTFIRLGLKPLVIVLNNDGYTVERVINNPTAAYHDVARWRWSNIPSAFGADSEVRVLQARNGSELDRALAVTEVERRLVFLEVKMDPMARPEFMDRFVGSLVASYTQTAVEGGAA